MRRVDLTGQQFGRLTVVSFHHSDKRRSFWLCRCSCGNDCIVSANDLRRGGKRSCGCLQKETQANNVRGARRHFEDLTGRRFGRLVVKSCEGVKKGVRWWKCLCDCGKEKTVKTISLVSGSTRSCGCLARELASGRMKKHGLFGTRIYTIWNDMIQRCTNPKEATYEQYGRRGITVCQLWRDVNKFKEWALNSGYDDSLTIDRIDPKLSYFPGNCRWIPLSENSARAHRTHGKSGSSLYNTWIHMIWRCENPKFHSYRSFGGCGVKVCEEWHSFKAFERWALANGYEKGLGIGRKDLNGDFTPENSAFFTPRELISKQTRFSKSLKKKQLD